MYKKYLMLAVCLALAVTLIHAPDSCGKARAAKTFDGKVWVRIDEIEGHEWNEIAIHPRDRAHGDWQCLLIYLPIFNVYFGQMFAYSNNSINDNRIRKDGVGAVEQLHHNECRPRYNCRLD
jgi:hypothetical protein